MSEVLVAVVAVFGPFLLIVCVGLLLVAMGVGV
jgi:hypothetical protein